MLEVDQIQAFYGESHILQGVTVAVPKAGRVSLLGRNGAGKSTLLKAIMNAGPRLRGGAVRWEGRDLATAAPHTRARLGLCLVPEDRRILAHLTVLENLAMARHAVPVGETPPDPAAILAAFPMLVPLARRLGTQLSGGQQQMVAFARALAARPRMMLLDEPTEGVAPVIVQQLARDVVTACTASGVGLLLCEQNIWFARRCTDHVYVLDSGRIVFGGSWAEFDADGDIKTRHLAV